MTIYLDVVLIENLCMNYIILFATGYILKLKRRHIFLILSAFLGAVYSILSYMEILPIYSNIFVKIILSIVMIYIAYRAKSAKELFKEIVFFYFISFVFGGCAFALLYFIKPEEILMRNGILIGTYPIKIAVLGGLIGFTITAISFYIIKSKLSKKDIFCDITIFFHNKYVKANALIDTGNMLKDPITNLPVIVIEKEMLKNILPNIILDNLEKIIGGDIEEKIYEDENLEYISRFRVIPFKSLGKENGLLLGFKADRIVIQRGETINKIDNIIIGIYNNKFSKKGKYSALIGLDILEGSEENEFFESISGKY